MSSEQEALDYYVEPTGDRISCFVAARRDARLTAGRDADTGAIVSEPSTGCWLGAIGYLLLLDQLGTAVQPRLGPGVASPAADVPSIMKALEWFAPSVTPKGRKVLYALRCALAHDYSLFNKHGKDPELQHEFALHRGTGRLIQLPTTSWSGSYTAIGREPTYVSLRLLGDRVEEACEAVRSTHRRGQLTIGVGLTPDDLAQRYTLKVYK